MNSVKEKDWIERIVFFDFEVFSHDWLVCFESYAYGSKYYVHNDSEALRRFLQKNSHIILCGYNCKSYDNYILKACLCDLPPREIKEVNDWMIQQDQAGWTYPLPYRIELPPTTDLFLDITPPKGLKEIEGNLGMNIVESSIPFEITTPLTSEQFSEVLRYCRHDVSALRPLFEERKEYLKSKVKVGTLAGLSVEKSLYMTNGQLTASFLKAKKQYRNDEREYVYPDQLHRHKIPQDVLDFFSRLEDDTIDSQTLFSSKLNTEIAGCPHVVGFGGLHGALPCYEESSTADRVILNADVGSYYPTLMIKYGYVSRNIPNASQYEDVYHTRLEAKQAGQKEIANALKLILNTKYGCMLNEYSELYDPLQARSVCISGQLFLIDLIQSLTQLESVRLIQSNTDGIMFSVDRTQRQQAESIVSEWEQRTGFTMEYDEIVKVAQKDVNNYVMMTIQGDIKCKGGYVSDYKGGNFKSKNTAIISKAIVEHLLYDKDVRELIEAETDVTLFQQIGKAGRTYHQTVQEIDGKLEEVQRVNRIYATNDYRYGRLYKVKVNEKGEIIRKDKLANCPDHCLIDNDHQVSIEQIDKSFYIELAQKRINDFKGIKMKRTGKQNDKAKRGIA